MSDFFPYGRDSILGKGFGIRFFTTGAGIAQ
jgi:hypothetical protein